ncbi:zf-CCHC domain-containing protein [Tanacetum coccineum]
MTLYNDLSCKEYKRVFMCKTAKEVWHTLIITHQGNSQVKNCKIDLLTQEYEKFSISNEEAIDSGFTRFNAIVTSLKSLDPDYSNKNHVRKFLRALPLKWRAKVTDIEEAKELATLPLDQLVRNLNVYEMILENDGVVSKTTTKDKVKSLALKLKNFSKGNRFGRVNRFGNSANKFGRGRGNSFGNKGGESSKPKGACYNYGIEGHFTSECKKPKEKNDFIGGAWSDSEDDGEHQNDAPCLMAIDSQDVVSKPSSSNNDLNIIDLQKENEELLKFNKDFAKTFEKLLNEKRSLKKENSKLSSNTTTKGLHIINITFQRRENSCPNQRETMRIEEYLIVTFNEILPKPKSSPSVEDDMIDEPVVQDLNGSSSLQVNVSDEGYPKSVKEA